ncbi:YjbE family integral membrane protein [Jezberella montanilacus]|jgi:YjbE family integral membrane protein|uniref:YjbE family integral membrane protein n=1 Tax=Jezberella montanilacus TaxID=323426 RepID=A0A2T0XDV2_9BURK|nr:TerC family protein [Jezberella montanilacus]PRY97102.1 YjbE family integral membrane protein [Jezberella montanilacus]
MTSISLSLTDFWIPLLQIIGVNIVLSGDNAVVIAMAARSLAPDQQKKAIFWGSGAAIVMRILLTIFAVKLLVLPYLKLVGAALLLWIGYSLLAGGDDEEIDSSDHLLTAIKTILLADLVMSLDNVIGVAAAAKGSTFLLVAGLAISIPLVIFGASMLLKVMERFPLIITVGGGLLGWIAGDMAVNDPAIKDWVDTTVPHLHEAAPVLGVLIVLVTGKFLSKSSPAE